MEGCFKSTAIGCWKKWKMLQPWDMYQQLSSRTVQSFHGGYQAGYYGYMWSEVLALDMLSALAIT
jgi:Zn-dependent oligopeptidase